MDFSARADIKAPIDFVFDQVTDFKQFESAIIRRGGDVERLSGNDAAVVGTKWKVNFQLRGQHRSVTAQVVKVDQPNDLMIDIASKNADGVMAVELTALSQTVTCMTVKMNAVAKTIPAKLLFQSIRFARVKSDRKFNAMIAGFASDIEARYRS